MSGPFKMKSGNTTPFKQMGSSPAQTHEPGHETKEIKGTSILGKSPKEFAKSVGKHALNVITPVASILTGGASGRLSKHFKASRERKEKIKDFEDWDSKNINPNKPTYIFPTKAKKEGKVLDKMTKTKKPAKRTITDETKMKPPYKKPVGPITD